MKRQESSVGEMRDEGRAKKDGEDVEQRRREEEGEYEGETCGLGARLVSIYMATLAE
jgi:hypothetical protein